MFYTYILYSKSLDKFYIGATKQLDIRIQKHNTNHKGYTGKSNDWKIVYHEQFESWKEALSREKQIKNKKSRKFIELLIED